MGKDFLQLFREREALLEGHFGLTSGRHSPTYLQCAMVLQYPEIAREIGKELAAMADGDIDLVVSPAVGGIVVGHETASNLGVRAIFSERVDGEMTFRRGFYVKPGERILAVEDVVTTGGSIREAALLAEKMGGDLVATASIAHRYTDKPTPPTDRPHHSLLQIHAPAYDPADCPLCKEEIPLQKPGSRTLR
ncbi:MAG: orotate phosphoribosyltransferase [bacterium]